MTPKDSLYLVSTDGTTRPLFYVVTAPFYGTVNELAGPQPRLNLWATKYSKARAAHRAAHRMVGSSEAQGAEVSGAVDYYLRAMGREVRDSLRTRGELRADAHQPNRRDERKFQGHLRTAADDAVDRDARGIHEVDGKPVESVALTEEFAPRVFPKDWRDRENDYVPQDVYNGHWCKACGLSHTARYGACRHTSLVTAPCKSCTSTLPLDGVDGSMCKRCWNTHHEGNIRAQERMLPEGSVGRVYGDHNSEDAGDGPPEPIHAQGVVSDPTGDTAADRVDLGDVATLIADEILSDRERQVLEHLSAGYSVPEIASILGVDRGSVHRYRDRARDKLTPRRRRLSWRQSAARFLPLVREKARRPNGSHVPPSLLAT